MTEHLRDPSMFLLAEALVREGTPEPRTHDAPVPWRVVASHDAAICAIVDAEGRTVVAAARAREAGRIVDAVNEMERAYREDRP